MQFYEQSLDSQMRECETRLSTLDRVQDAETEKILKKLQHFLSRFTGGTSGIQMMFASLWLQQSRTNMDIRITSWVNDAKKVVAEKMYLWADNICNLAGSAQFKRAGEQWDALKRASAMLQHHFAGLEHILPGGGRVNIKDKLIEAEECITQEVTAAITKYKEMSLREFVEHPPMEIFDRLEKQVIVMTKFMLQ